MTYYAYTNYNLQVGARLAIRGQRGYHGITSQGQPLFFILMFITAALGASPASQACLHCLPRACKACCL